MKGYEPPLHPRLSHLDAEQVDELVRRYYARDGSVKSLMDEYGVSGKASSFVSLLPPIVHANDMCPYCVGQCLVSARSSRDSSQRNSPACPKCHHQNNSRCACQACKAAAFAYAKELEGKKRATIRRKLSGIRSPDIDIDGLTLRDAVFILVLFRHSVSEDLHAVSPYLRHREPLAPTESLQDELIKTLWRQRIISIDPESKPEAFDFTEDVSDCPTCNLTKVDWMFLPGTDPVAKKQFIAELERIARDGPWPEDWRYEVFELWHDIAKGECFEYYDLQLSQRGYEAEFGEKTNTVFDNLLETFSIGQVFNLTWQAVRDTTDYIVKKQLPRYHAKNTFIGAIQKKADKHRAEKWVPHVSRRDFDCPQSILSAVFFDLFMGVAGKSLETMPYVNDSKMGRAIGDAEIPF